MLAEDTFSNTVLQDYSSVTARFNVSIDSSAWFPDLAAAVNVTHNQFVDAMEPLGFSVVRHDSAYLLSAYLQHTHSHSPSNSLCSLLHTGTASVLCCIRNIHVHGEDEVMVKKTLTGAFEAVAMHTCCVLT